MITFKYTTDEYGCFSNFSPHPIIVDGKEWKTTEAWYQAQKFTDPDLQEQIRLKPTPKASKILAQINHASFRRDWDDVRVGIMFQALKYKVNQHKFVYDKLMETGKEEIWENNPKDLFWGGNPFTKEGKNTLGQLWMDLRWELRINEQPI